MKYTLTNNLLCVMCENNDCRHVLEYMVAKQPNQPGADTGAPAPSVSHLASSHENVTILFTE
jgi:hypothetical protein